MAKNFSLEYSETLDEHGNFLQNIIGQNKHQKDFYKFAVDGTVSYCPRFTYHGFRYVRLTGARSFSVEDFTIHIIGTDMARTGFFECSDERLTRLKENIYRSQQGNMISIPTDCPQRERTGWTGDMQIFAPTACFNMDVEMFLRKWLLDMRYEQLPDGQLPHIIPYFP
ncbi:MAG: family 78 glycoside hydrolase catalytic domain, partial [Clostridiales bacterium]|nr:family 78 glycoside hydrolase catalytic domain [Clostridiales bacterium]